MPLVVQAKTGQQATATSWSLQFDADVTAGNRLVAVIRCSANDGTDLAVTAGTWEKRLAEHNNNAAVAVFSREATGDGQLTITVQTAIAVPGALAIFEVSDCGAIDVAFPTFSTGTSVALGPLTPTDTNHFAVAAVWQAGTNGGGLTWSSLPNSASPNTQGSIAWGVRNSAAAYTETVAWTTSRVYAGILVLFRDGPIDDDVTAPTCTVTPVHGAGQAVSVHDSVSYDEDTETVTITGTATDARGVTGIEIRIDGGAWTAVPGGGVGGAWTAVAGTVPWAYQLDLTTLAVLNTHTVQVRATDAAGNVGTSPLVNFYYSHEGVWVFGGIGQHLVPVNYRTWEMPTAYYVSLAGNDTTGDGTVGSPWRTLNKAHADAPVGATIEVDGGTYRETVTINADKQHTIQAAPGEDVWYSASDDESTGWAAGTGVWTKTITGGGIDYTAQFTSNQTIDPAFPLAGNLATVIIDGVQQTMVAHPAVPTAGQYKVVGNVYTIGTNPAGKVIEVPKAAREVLMSVTNAPGTTLRRIGFKHAPTAPSGPDGALRILPSSPNVTLDQCKFHQNQNCGVQIRSAGATVTGNEFTQNGRLGLSMNETDDWLVEGNTFGENNLRRFDIGGAAGGFKVTEARDCVLKHNDFLDNFGHGFWIDRSCLRVDVLANKAERNLGLAYKIEVSAQVNVVSNSSDGDVVGIGIGECNDVFVWNNTITNPVETHISALDGSRRAHPTNPVGDLYGFPLDSRYGYQAELLWELNNIVVKNNVMIGGPDDDATTPFQMLRVSDTRVIRTKTGCATTNGSTTLTTTVPDSFVVGGVDGVGGDKGQAIQGPGIQAGTTIASVTSATSVVLSLPATATATGQTVVVNPKVIGDNVAEADFNVYHRLFAGIPIQLIAWPADNGTSAYDRYQTTTAFNLAHAPNEANAIMITNASYVTIQSYPTNLMPSATYAANGTTVPPAIAALVGHSGLTPPRGLLVAPGVV